MSLGLSACLSGRSPSVLAIVLFAAVFVLYRLVQRFVSYQRYSRIIKDKGCKPCPKYPHKDPIFGFDLFRENLELSKTGGLWTKLQERYARINGGVNTFTNLLLGEEMINTAEPDNIKAILATQFKDFNLSTRRKESFQPVFGHGIFTTDGSAWEASRALLRPNFVRNQVADLRTFDDHVTKMISKIPRDGSTVDLQALFFMLTLDSGKLGIPIKGSPQVGTDLFSAATEFLFGQSTNVLGSGDATTRGDMFSDAFGYVTEKIGVKSRVGKLAVLMPDPKWNPSCEFVHEYIQDYVEQALEKRTQYVSVKEKEDEEAARYVFLNELAKTGYGAKKIQDELTNVLVAGRDTTASLLAHVWYVLARRPDVFSKLRAEILKLDGKAPSFEQIKEMKYLQYVLNESQYIPLPVPIQN
jgi:cytochrome P450